jgi:hypothetical protein
MDVVAMAHGISEGDLALAEMTLQHLNPDGKPLSPLFPKECKKLMVVVERNRKKKL